MEGGEAVPDSRVIVEYLDTLSPVGKLDSHPGAANAPKSRSGRPTARSAPLSWRFWRPPDGRGAKQRSDAWIDRQMVKD